MSWVAYWAALQTVLTALLLLLLGAWGIVALLFPRNAWVRALAIIGLILWLALVLVVTQGRP